MSIFAVPTAAILAFALVARAGEPVATIKPLPAGIATLIATGKPLSPAQALAAMPNSRGLQRV